MGAFDSRGQEIARSVAALLNRLGVSFGILAVSCPACAVMLGDAVKSNNMDERIQVKEISEIINERLNDPAGTGLSTDQGKQRQGSNTFRLETR